MLLAVDGLMPNKRGHQIININRLRKRSEILKFFIDDVLDLKKNYFVGARRRKSRPNI
jgi:hypothetical protein